MASVGISICSVRNIDVYFWDRFLKLVLGLRRFPRRAGCASVNYHFICYWWTFMKKNKMRTYFPVMSIVTDLSQVETPNKIYFWYIQLRLWKIRGTLTGFAEKGVQSYFQYFFIWSFFVALMRPVNFKRVVRFLFTFCFTSSLKSVATVKLTSFELY